MLTAHRNAKMARSSHAYMRGNTIKFYDWLATAAGRALPDGPSVWICGDCHVGNLGPVANLQGAVNIQIRDLDQTVIGNPVHDLVRLGLSLATAVRSADLPGVTTARMIEQMMVGYGGALRNQRSPQTSGDGASIKASLEDLAEERIEDVRPTIPRGDKFWEITKREARELERVIASKDVQSLVTAMHHRDDDAKIKILDAAYWVKGCSSLGRLRYAVLVGIGKHPARGEICFLDIKEATSAFVARLCANFP
jgi:uncharacterized protein (DUF2252 family)